VKSECTICTVSGTNKVPGKAGCFNSSSYHSSSIQANPAYQTRRTPSLLEIHRSLTSPGATSSCSLKLCGECLLWTVHNPQDLKNHLSPKQIQTQSNTLDPFKDEEIGPCNLGSPLGQRSQGCSQDHIAQHGMTLCLSGEAASRKGTKSRVEHTGKIRGGVRASGQPHEEGMLQKSWQRIDPGTTCAGHSLSLHQGAG
jgi:hypothetical protein